MEAACGNDYRPARGSPAIMMMIPPKYWHDLHGYRYNRPTFCSFFDMGLAMQVDRSNAVVNRIKMVQHCGAILPQTLDVSCAIDELLWIVLTQYDWCPTVDDLL